MEGENTPAADALAARRSTGDAKGRVKVMDYRRDLLPVEKAVALTGAVCSRMRFRALNLREDVGRQHRNLASTWWCLGRGSRLAEAGE